MFWKTNKNPTFTLFHKVDVEGVNYVQILVTMVKRELLRAQRKLPVLMTRLNTIIRRFRHCFIDSESMSKTKGLYRLVWANSVSSFQIMINGRNSLEPFWCQRGSLIDRMRLVHLDPTRGLTTFTAAQLHCHSAATRKESPSYTIF